MSPRSVRTSTGALTADLAGRRPNPTQLRMLDAALRIWQIEAPSTLFSGLSVSRVAKQAGVTRATFYAYWPTIEAFLADLLDNLPDIAVDGYRLTDDSGPRPTTATMHVIEDLYEVSERQLQAITEDPGFWLRLAFTAKVDDPEVAEPLRQHYRRTEARAEAFSTSVREHWGREIRPPLDVAQMHAIYSAFAEGYAVRRAVDPDLLSIELYGQMVLALTMFVTRRTDDPRTLPDLLDAATTWPAVGMLLRNASLEPKPPGSSDTLDATSAERVIRHARRLQASMSWHDLSLADVATVAGISEDTLIRAFGSKAGLAMAVFMMNVHERYDALDWSGEPATDLRRMIAAGSAELQRSPGLTQNVVQVLSGTTLPVNGVIDWTPVSRLISQIRLAQSAGQLRGDIDAPELALTINRLQLLQAQSAPDTRTQRVSMIELLLLGAGLPPDDRAPIASTFAPRWAEEAPDDPFVG